MKKTLVLILAACALIGAFAFVRDAAPKRIVVDPTGKGDFKTITEALKSLPDSSATDRIVFIKKGTYHEKVFVTQNHLILQGEDEKATIITQAIARDIFHCETNSNDDWGVATINLRGSDVTLKNLSIINSYGWDHKTDTTFTCTMDTKQPQH